MDIVRSPGAPSDVRHLHAEYGSVIERCAHRINATRFVTTGSGDEESGEDQGDEDAEREELLMCVIAPCCNNRGRTGKGNTDQRGGAWPFPPIAGKLPDIRWEPDTTPPRAS